MQPNDTKKDRANKRALLFDNITEILTDINLIWIEK